MPHVNNIASPAFRSLRQIPRRSAAGAPLRMYGATGLGHTAYHHVGGITDSASRLVQTAAVVGAAYHGYRRTGKVRWAVGWALLAALAPYITTGVALAQGFGKRKAGG